MCGFCGFTGQVAGREEVIREMADRITHRGPDSEGYYLDGSIAMAFRRLSIIDLGGGSQPIYNEDRSKVLMFNGEIYNYRSLREELLAAGHVFTTETDSEVLLHGFEGGREDLLPRLRGMFAFAIWDKRETALFLARDNFGIKPMHYALLPDGDLLFGSEIKSLLAHPDFVKEFNPEALDNYLSFSVFPAARHLFQGRLLSAAGALPMVQRGEGQRAPLFRIRLSARRNHAPGRSGGRDRPGVHRFGGGPPHQRRGSGLFPVGWGRLQLCRLLFRRPESLYGGL